MSNTTTITKSAKKAAQKAKPSGDAMKDPKSLAAAGAALLALPYAAQGIAKLAGGAREKASQGGGALCTNRQLLDHSAGDHVGDHHDIVLPCRNDHLAVW